MVCIRIWNILLHAVLWGDVQADTRNLEVDLFFFFFFFFFFLIPRRMGKA